MNRSLSDTVAARCRITRSLSSDDAKSPSSTFVHSTTKRGEGGLEPRRRTALSPVSRDPRARQLDTSPGHSRRAPRTERRPRSGRGDRRQSLRVSLAVRHRKKVKASDGALVQINLSGRLARLILIGVENGRAKRARTFERSAHAGTDDARRTVLAPRRRSHLRRGVLASVRDRRARG